MFLLYLAIFLSLWLDNSKFLWAEPISILLIWGLHSQGCVGSSSVALPVTVLSLVFGAFEEEVFLLSLLCPYNMNKSAWQALSFQITVCVISSLSVLTTQSGSGCRLIRHYQICCISAVVSINLVIKMC